jgi:hypothetical protein
MAKRRKNSEEHECGYCLSGELFESRRCLDKHLKKFHSISYAKDKLANNTKAVGSFFIKGIRGPADVNYIGFREDGSIFVVYYDKKVYSTATLLGPMAKLLHRLREDAYMRGACDKQTKIRQALGFAS